MGRYDECNFNGTGNSMSGGKRKNAGRKKREQTATISFRLKKRLKLVAENASARKHIKQYIESFLTKIEKSNEKGV